MVAKHLRIVLFLFAFFVFFSQLTPGWASQITDIRFWSAPDHTRVVVDLTEPTQFESASQENPPLLNLELKGSLQTSNREVVVNDLFLTKITLTDQGHDKVKIVFHQRKPLTANIFLLKPFEDKPHRLVIDLVDIALEKRNRKKGTARKRLSPRG